MCAKKRDPDLYNQYVQKHEEELPRRIERAKWQRFLLLANRWENVQTARAFLEAIKTFEIDDYEEIDGKGTADWIAWAEKAITKNDPLARSVMWVFEDVDHNYKMDETYRSTAPWWEA